MKRVRSLRIMPTAILKNPILTAAFITLCLLISSCDLPFIGEEPTPTPLPSEVVTFEMPIFSTTLSPGETVPATQLKYLGREESAYKVTIDGQEALKRAGDSFQWRGVIAPGVAARYNLRISPTLSSSDMLAIGLVEFNILNPVPIALDNPGSDDEGVLHFSNVKIDHRVGPSGQIPGTPFIFEEMTIDGARFSGMEGYPYRSVGDSVFWSGSLRDNVDANLEMRVAGSGEDHVRLIGIAELWITVE